MYNLTLSIINATVTIMAKNSKFPLPPTHNTDKDGILFGFLRCDTFSVALNAQIVLLKCFVLSNLIRRSRSSLKYTFASTYFMVYNIASMGPATLITKVMTALLFCLGIYSYHLPSLCESTDVLAGFLYFVVCSLYIRGFEYHLDLFLVVTFIKYGVVHYYQMRPLWRWLGWLNLAFILLFVDFIVTLHAFWFYLLFDFCGTPWVLKFTHFLLSDMMAAHEKRA